jgi:hypothetical protein
MQIRTMRITIIVMIMIIAVSTSGMISPINAETGKGTDVFKVILSLFDIQPTTGDVVAIVTVNDESKVKFFETSNIATNASQAGGGIIQYVATFPNVNVNVGDEYKACALLLKDVGTESLTCTTGQNSPAKRPEFVDLSLASVAGASLAEVETEDAEDEEEDAEDEEEDAEDEEEAATTPTPPET